MRNASQRAQTSAAAQRDAKTADAMEKARLKEEAKPVAGYIPAPKEAEAIAQGLRGRAAVTARSGSSDARPS